MAKNQRSKYKFPKNGYHIAETPELQNFMSKISLLQDLLKFYKTNFTGRTKNYVYCIGNVTVKHLEVHFSEKNFMHLCGIDYVGGAKKFTSALQNRKIAGKCLAVKDDGSTFQKLNIINRIKLFNTVNCHVSQKNPTANVGYYKLICNNPCAIAIKNNGYENFPLSLLNTNQANAYPVAPQQVVAVVDTFEAKNNASVVVDQQNNLSGKIQQYIDAL